MQHYSNELFLLDDHGAFRLGFCGRRLNFNESEVLNSRTGTSVHAYKAQTHTVTRREYMFSTSNPSMQRSHIIVFFSALLSIRPFGLLEEVQKHICDEKKNPCFYSNIEDMCCNFLEHDLKVTNKTEASGMVGESLKQAQNRHVGANYQIL